MHGPLFITNTTKSGLLTRPSVTHDVFVTSEFIGGLRGDPAGGATRCVLANTNGGGSGFWCGRQSGPGTQMQAYWDKIGAIGIYDYGVITCARTITKDVNKVLPREARHTLSGNIESPWHHMHAASQSLARDLSLSSGFELLQQFVPELKVLRIDGSQQTAKLPAAGGTQTLKGALYMEVVASFSWTTTTPKPFGFTFRSGAGNVTIDCTDKYQTGEAPCMVAVRQETYSCPIANCTTPPTVVVTMPVLPAGAKRVDIHSILDGEIVETIVNNRSAMVHYSVNPTAGETDVQLFAASDVEGSITTWEMRAANNADAPPLRAPGALKLDDTLSLLRPLVALVLLAPSSVGQYLHHSRSPYGPWEPVVPQGCSESTGVCASPLSLALSALFGFADKRVRAAVMQGLMEEATIRRHSSWMRKQAP